MASNRKGAQAPLESDADRAVAAATAGVGSTIEDMVADSAPLGPVVGDAAPETLPTPAPLSANDQLLALIAAVKAGDTINMASIDMDLITAFATKASVAPEPTHLAECTVIMRFALNVPTASGGERFPDVDVRAALREALDARDGDGEDAPFAHKVVRYNAGTCGKGCTLASADRPDGWNASPTRTGRATSSGAPRATGSGGTSVGDITYQGPNGADAVSMTCASAATKAATDFATATECAKYVRDHAAGKSLNARVFINRDIDAGRVPAGTFRGPRINGTEPAPVADAKADAPTTDATVAEEAKAA